MSDRTDKPKQIVIFSDARTALMREASKHEDLVDLLAQYPLGEDYWSEKLGEIAAYCGVIMDGMYTQQKLEDIYPVLFNKLRQKSMIIVIPPTPAPTLKH